MSSQGPASSPRPSLSGAGNLRGFEARRLQTLTGHTALTQDILKTASDIIQRAMEAGQVRARVQTLHLSHQQFTYTGSAGGSETHPLYDAYTLLPLPGVEKRIAFASVVREFVHWIREQGLQFLCTTQCFPGAGGSIPIPFVHVEAIFVPVTPAPRGARALEIWNTVYMQKCLDASALGAWNQRCADAIRRGASHFVVCTLYRWSDFFPPSEGGGIACAQPVRHHLTMAPLEDLLGEKKPLFLNAKFDVMVRWVAELGYAWTLTMENADKSEWAYFCVLLDPLEQYQ